MRPAQRWLNIYFAVLLGVVVFATTRSCQSTPDARSAAVDTTVVAFGRAVDTVIQVDTVRETLVRRLPALRSRTDTILARVVDTVWADSARMAVAVERAAADSARFLADSALEARSDLLLRSKRVIDSVVEDRNRWRRAAKRPFGLACAVGPTATAAGLAVVGVTCGLSVGVRLF